jgi:AcrR family transcriptional regulator
MSQAPSQAIADADFLRLYNAQAGNLIINRILTAAGDILASGGYERFNTTAVAKQAGIGLATVYRHFPDKHSLLTALIDRLQIVRMAKLAPLLNAIATSPDWREAVAAAVRGMWDFRKSNSAIYAIRRASQLSPELWQWEEDLNKLMTERLSHAICHRSPMQDFESVTMAARIAVEFSMAMLDMANRIPSQADQIIENNIRLAIFQLTPFFSDNLQAED